MSELHKALAESAVTALFIGAQNDADNIIAALNNETIEPEVLMSLSALSAINTRDNKKAINLLKSWCNQNAASQPHALLALAYWQEQQKDDCAQMCNNLLSSNADDSVKSMANSLLQELS
ncbi:hypothetical protein [Pleionea sediminis]|uniref:hypothetical protein n=1 Tax=Pleionea sediminis TaxID=2569479 RepID=UPI001185359F|nr:hypothetical protein [Pleionea sediminis]